MNTKKYAIVISGISKKYILADSKKPYKLLSEEISDFFKRLGRFKKIKSKEFWALKNVSFKVEKGEIVGVIGANGAGKSTLLKVLSQITFPTSGKIILNGKVASLLEVGTGFNPELSGRENIYLNGSILGMTRREIDNKITEIIEFSGVGEFIDEPVKHYSSGMYVRLAFSVAAFLESEILLIDEILSVGDANFQKKSLGKVNDITRDKKRTVIFVSHDLNAISKLCSKVILLDDGKVVKFGNSKEVIKYYLTNISKDTFYQESNLDWTKRMGTHEIIIDRTEIVNSKGTKTESVKSGGYFKLRIHFRLNGDHQIDNLMVGFLLKTDWDSPVFVQQNILEGIKFNSIKKDGYFEFEMKEFPIAAGNYVLNCSLIKNSGIGGQYYDNIDNAIKFEITKSDFFGSGVLPSPEHGSVYLRGKWSKK